MPNIFDFNASLSQPSTQYEMMRNASLAAAGAPQNIFNFTPQPVVGNPGVSPVNPAQTPPATTGNRILDNPNLSSALSRMAAAVAQADEQNVGIGNTLAFGLAAFGNEMQRQDAIAREIGRQQQQDEIARQEFALKERQVGQGDRQLDLEMYKMMNPQLNLQERAQRALVNLQNGTATPEDRMILQAFQQYRQENVPGPGGFTYPKYPNIPGVGGQAAPAAAPSAVDAAGGMPTAMSTIFSPEGAPMTPIPNPGMGTIFDAQNGGSPDLSGVIPYGADKRLSPEGQVYAEKASIDKALEKSQPGGTLTPAQKKVDEKFAEDYADFAVRGGVADVNKQLDQLNEVLARLESGEDLTGTIHGIQPRFLRNITDKKSVDAQDLVEDVVQRNLRLILGAQFTEKEGERLIQRAYNPSLSEKTNAKRVRRLIDQIRFAAETKQQAIDYFEANGTLQGWEGKMPDLSSISEGLKDGATSKLDSYKAKYGLE